MADKPQPRVRIEVPHGESIFTRVFLDGEELRYVTRVQFDTGDSNDKPWDKMARVTITFHADLEVVGEPEIIAEPYEELDPKPYLADGSPNPAWPSSYRAIAEKARRIAARCRALSRG